jgi:hypothetical protein
VRSGGDRPSWLDDWIGRNERQIQQTSRTDLPDWKHTDDPHDRILDWCWRTWLQRWGIGTGKNAEVHLYTEGKEGVRRWRFDEEGTDGDGIAERDFESVKLKVISEDEIGAISEDGSKVLYDGDTTPVIYDRHGGLLQKGFYESDQSEDSVKKKLEYTENFCNAFDKNSADFSRLNYPPKRQANRRHLVHQLVEAGLLRVVVLDERIAKLAGRNPRKSMFDAVRFEDFWHQAQATNVFLVTHITINDEEIEVAKGRTTSQEDLFTKLTLNLDGELSFRYTHKWEPRKAWETKEDWDGPCKVRRDLDADVLVIHRTFVKSLAEKMDDERVESLIERFQKSIPWVIIDSGTSHSLGSEAPFKFLPFSQLEGQISQVGSSGIVSKVQLAKRIMTLTRTHE